MNDSTPLVDRVSILVWRDARRLAEALERSCTVDELRQRVIDLAGITCLLRGFPADLALRPLMAPAPDTIPASWHDDAKRETGQPDGSSAPGRRPGVSPLSSGTPAPRVPQQRSGTRRVSDPAATPTRTPTKDKSPDKPVRPPRPIPQSRSETCTSCGRPVGPFGHCGC